MKPKVATIWLTLKSSYREEHNTAPIDNKDARRRGALKAQPPARRGPLKRRPPHTKTMNRGGASPYFGWDPATPFSTLTIGVGFVHATVRSFRLSRLAFFFPGVRVCVTLRFFFRFGFCQCQLSTCWSFIRTTWTWTRPCCPIMAVPCPDPNITDEQVTVYEDTL